MAGVGFARMKAAGATPVGGPLSCCSGAGAMLNGVEAGPRAATEALPMLTAVVFAFENREDAGILKAHSGMAGLSMVGLGVAGLGAGATACCLLLVMGDLAGRVPSSSLNAPVKASPLSIRARLPAG